MGSDMGEMEDLRSPGVVDELIRRPLVWAAAAFMGGIFAHEAMSCRPGVYLGMAAVLAVVGFVRWPAIVGSLALAAALFLAGVVTAQQEAFYFPRDHIARFTGDDAQLVTLELRIDRVPRTLSGRFTVRALSPRQATQATVLRVLTRDGWKPACGSLLVQVNEPKPDLAIAQRVEALGYLQHPPPASNPGQFDWAGYYRADRIVSSLHIPHAGNIRILESPGAGILDRLRIGVRKVLERGFPADRTLDHALLRALVLGDSDPQLRDVQAEFIRTGTSHHLAISGMHIAILGWLVYLACRALRQPPRRATWICLGFVILYGAIALPSPPVVRSVLLCIAFGVGRLMRRSEDGVQLLALSVMAMLAYHPMDLYAPGFQLSFGTVLGLMVFARPAMGLIKTFADRDVQVARSWRRPVGAPAGLLWLRHYLAEAIVVGVVAWLVSLPLILFHFNQINPYAIFASLLLGIPVFLSLVAGLLKILLGLLLPFLSPALAWLAGSAVALMRWIVDVLAKIPGSDAPLPRPSLWMLAAYYALLIIFLLGRHTPLWAILPRPPLPKRSRLAEIVTSRAFRHLLLLAPVVALLMLLLPLTWRSGVGDGRARITLLSVGAGQCAVVQTPSGKIVLIDAGSAAMSDSARVCVVPYLRRMGVRRIDRIFVSHANEDHFNAIEDLAALYAIGEVRVTPMFRKHAVGNGPAEKMLRTLDRIGCPISVVSAGQTIPLDDRVSTDILWPPADTDLDANNASLVLRLCVDDRSILFPGDIQSPAHEALLAAPDSLSADILVAPHHGSAELTTGRFLDAINPKHVVCSNGRKLSRKQKEFDSLAEDRALYRTSLSGAITVEIAPGGELRVDPFRSRIHTKDHE